jgi:hypothetical protein
MASEKVMADLIKIIREWKRLLQQYLSRDSSIMALSIEGCTHIRNTDVFIISLLRLYIFY